MTKILKEGYLYKAHPREGIFAVTVFQKRYFVLWSSGTLEYYSSYQKQPEEYCSTMNLKETLDIVAPISVGKKHNIIRLSIKKRGREKEYWLDCDCPSLLNEWLNCMISVAGLAPEDNDDCFLYDGQGKFAHVSRIHDASTNDTTIVHSNRRLPSLPMVMDLEYEVPSAPQQQTDDREFYEEISPVGSPVVSSSLPRKYTPNLTKSDNNELLKRSPLPSSDNATPSPTTSPTSITSSPVPITTSPAPVPINPMQDLELQKRLSFRRQEVYDAMDIVKTIDELEDLYEEVQFTTEVTVGERNHSKVTLRNKGRANNNVIIPKSDNNKPVKSAWDNGTSPESNSRPPLPIPPRDSAIFESSDDPLQLLPPVPPRTRSYDSGLDSAPLYIDRDNSPPPVPERINRSDKRSVARILTATCLDQSGSGYNSESSDQSGDATIVKGSLSLLANVIGNSNKPLPAKPPKPTPPSAKPTPPSIKPKPHPPAIAKKPSFKSFDQLKGTTRPPVLPKPTKGPSIAPKSRSHSAIQSSCSPEIPPKSVVLPRQPQRPPRQVCQSNNVLPALPPKNSPKILPKHSSTRSPPGLPPNKPVLTDTPLKPNLPTKSPGTASGLPSNTSLPQKSKNYSKGSFNNHKRPPMPLPKIKSADL